jgi:cytoskeleton protein RodZ
MVEAEPQTSETSASDEKPQDEANALEEIPQVNIENEIQSNAPAEARVSVWRALLSRLRFSPTRAEPNARKETDKESNLEAKQETIESNVKEFNPIIKPVDSTRSSQEIFNDLGRELRERREMLSLTVEEVERHIHVRSAFLRALERGALEELPSPVQTRGMFANYAGFLDLDVDALLLRFADGLQMRHRERHPQKPSRGKPIKVNEKVPPLSTFIAGDLLIGGGMIILLILFTIWGVSRVIVMRSQYYPQVTAPAISNILAVTSQPSAESQLVTLIPAQDTPATATPAATSITATLPANVNVQLNILAVERTYMRVTVDGKVQFDGQAVPGTAYPYEAKKQIEVLVGSASGLSVIYNGNNLGVMGTFGQVVDAIYTAQGVITPTATPIPSNTATPRFSPVPTTTPSLIPMPTSGG